MFNYKDWWGWTFWIVLIFIVSDIVNNIDTLQRWKWGYWSIDLIPTTIVLVLWFLIFEMVRLNRVSIRLSGLEKKGIKK